MAVFMAVTVNAQSIKSVVPPALASIKEADLKKDIFILASDAFKGRRAGTLDELRSAAWVAQEAQQIGLEPAGDDGTYFQFYNLHRKEVSVTSSFSINNKPLTLWKDIWAINTIPSQLNGTIVWLNSLADTNQDYKGKIVAMQLQPPTPLPVPNMSLWAQRYTVAAIRIQGTTLVNHGATAVIFVADEMVENNMGFAGHIFKEGSYTNEGLAYVQPINFIPNTTPYLLVPQAMASILKANATIKADIVVNDYLYPSVNVVAKQVGRDAVLKNEYVLFSGHTDHDGIGSPVAGDSIWNGADDNASVCVAMLAIGRAWKASPGKRSALFVWHGAEERGLLGSRWYAENPTVKKESIVAVLNGDMIGRNSVDSAALLGFVAPHRNSLTLVNMAMEANAQLTHFAVDSSWDALSHPENWYNRSDHASYAHVGIPAIFFSSNLHVDYHTPRDEAKRISIPKLYKMTQWMYGTGWLVSESTDRVKLDSK